MRENRDDKQGRETARDLRRAISRQAWMTQRARNAMHRPAFILVISIATFVVALVSMVTMPRAQERAAMPLPTFPRPDTLSLVAQVAKARVMLKEADSALTHARVEAQTQAERIEALAAQALAADTLAELRRDSIAVALRALELMIIRTEQAPLASSYRALAELPGLRTDTRVRALVDTLTEIERQREGFGAIGGTNPIYVALTSQANEIGRTLRALATGRRDALRAELDRLEHPAQQIAELPTIDTLTFIAASDSARRLLAATTTELIERRAQSAELDVRERRARQEATEVAPTLALLAAALVLSVVIGFGVAFTGELRRPRVSTAAELERFLGIRVLSTIETPRPDVDRRRRRADRASPAYLDPTAEGYQLAYLALATEHPALLTVTVTGDDPTIAAVVASNLAAVAADEARSTLVLELDPSRRLSAALRSRSSPGVVEIARGDVSWPDALVEAPVGRDKTVDFIPLGSGGTTTPEQLTALLTRDGERLARYYDAILVVASIADTAGIAGALPSPDVVFCAQPGITPMRPLKAQLQRIQGSGGELRGIVLWNAEQPKVSGKAPSPSKEAAARTPEPAAVG